MPIRVAIVDDNRLVREGLAAMLDKLPDMRVVASAGAHPAFPPDARPDVLLLDVGLGEADSLGVAAAIQRDAPGVRVIAMDLIPSDDDIYDFVQVGVCGFVLKDASFDDFVDTIRRVAAGAKVLPPRYTESLLGQIVREAVGERVVPSLTDVRMTPREREVIALISEGLSNKEIAQRLGVASHTVKSHVRNVMEKLALHTRLQIAAYSRREGAP